MPFTKTTIRKKHNRKQNLLSVDFTSCCTDSNHFCTIHLQVSTHESLHIVPVQQIKDIEIVKDVSIYNYFCAVMIHNQACK